MFTCVPSGYATVEPSEDFKKVDKAEYNILLSDIQSKVQEMPGENETDNVYKSLDIYARIIDRYGKNVSGTLEYLIVPENSKSIPRTNLGNEGTQIPMKLINGIPSNGTFRATISQLKENSEINYLMYFKDEFGYSSDEYLRQAFANSTSFEPKPTLEPLYGYVEPNKPIVVRVDLKDDEFVVENVTLHYKYIKSSDRDMMFKERSDFRKTEHITSEGPYSFVPMKPLGEFVPKPNQDSARPLEKNETYQGSAGPFKKNTVLSFYVEAVDKDGSSLRSGYYILTVIPLRPSDRDPLLNFLNKIDIDTNVLNFNAANLTTDIQILLHESRFNNSVLPSVNDEFIHTIVTSEDAKSVKHVLSTELRRGDPPVSPKDEMANLTTMYNEIENSYGPISLQGDVSRYPFDEYNLDLIYIIPVKKVSFRDIPQNLFLYDQTVESSWEPYPIVTYSGITDQILKNLDLYCEASPHYYYSPYTNRESLIDPFPHDQFTLPIPICLDENLNEEDKKTVIDELRNESSVLHFKLIFQRNYTIYGIIIPILAIFFLLGAIFVFDFKSRINLIGSRLTLTLGIFALIFTLPEIINSMKPVTSSPTIADSMLSIIIIATIAFTVSSVLSSSSVIRNWFPKNHTWIDGIVFVVVSGIVVSYFLNYPSDITLWLVPIILFGLGYGLLLRLLGIKIIKATEEHNVKTTSNNRIVKRSPL